LFLSRNTSYWVSWIEISHTSFYWCCRTFIWCKFQI